MKPVQPFHVREGGNYWAAWGSKGWTAVTVLSAKRKWASVARVNPRTNETKSRNAKVRIDELVLRDPKQKGKDKPEAGPAQVFEEIRTFRESQKASQLELTASSEESDQPRKPSAWEGLSEQEIDDRQRQVWESLHGKGSWDNVPTADDW